ncbi:methyltransferase [Sediminicola sp. YIK13]|uniref:L-histidine N(alpha)-methyltransferase n=1 Tax=Sediminicola sp. YIK13 TaxID=1453352 RepID=UPI00072112EB|nr:L-histidine N(alpha)-methyltransferase [Sediminicola sp. YIK13]ALM08972.1 methyltransferase [Sediminicola sp. YIK13]
MHKNTRTITMSRFEEEVYAGLTANPKYLSSKYFYDAKGDKIFQDIMAMPEYYLTGCEYNILKSHKEDISALFSEGSNSFNLIELGAGDGKKTKILLKYLVERKLDFKYLPIDISQNALDQLEKSLQIEIPTLKTEPLQGTYLETLETINSIRDKKKVILFLGSNVGNLLHPQAVTFLKQVQGSMKEEDLFFVGFDQKKNPQTILDAYNDKAGITEAFNKNVLVRINTELKGDFITDNFLHWETYDPETGTAKSYLVSNKEQTVTIKELDLTITLKPWETIHTEISQKYDDEVVSWLAKEAGLKVVAQFSDEKKYYKNYAFKKI